MLPNHAPLIVAEQFGTMETMFPRRVDLGLGRAPGTDMMTASALRRDQHHGVYQFPEEVEQLEKYFDLATNKRMYERIQQLVRTFLLYIRFINRFCSSSCSKRFTLCICWTLRPSTNERSHSNLQRII